MVRFCNCWPWGGRNRVDAAEISRNQSLFYQKEPSGPETSHVLMRNTLPLKNVDLTLELLALRRSGKCRQFRDLQKSIVILSNGAAWIRNLTRSMKTRRQALTAKVG